MKKSYDLLKEINTKVPYDLQGSYKKIGDNRTFTSLNKVPREISGAYSTNWSYQSFKTTSNSASTVSTLPLQTSSVKHDQKLSVVQQLNQELARDNPLEIRKYLFEPDLKRENLKKYRMKENSNGLYKIFAKFFIKDKTASENHELCIKNKISYSM